MKPRVYLAFICCLVCAMAVPAAEYLGKIAFHHDGNLWMQDLPDGTARKVTTSGKAAYPALSATGRWLSYNEGTSTYVVDVANPHNQRKISADFLAAEWSPTADILAYTRSPGGLFVTQAGKWDEKLLVRDLPNVWSAIENFVWSPDGKQLAFVRVMTTGQKTTDRIADLYRIDVNGTGLHRLLRVTGDSYHPIISGWTPDGKYIIFLQDTAYSASLLADGVPLAAVPTEGGPVRVYSENTPVTGGLAVSPDGRGIAVLQREGRESWQNARLFITPIDQVRLRQLTDNMLAPLFPAWSPQGNLLAYAAGPAAENIEPPDIGPALAKRTVLLVDPATGVRQGGTNAMNDRDEYPQWSADGQHLLFARITPEGQAGLWMLNLTNQDKRRVVERFSPDSPEDTGWRGFYGTVGWESILDYWPGRRLAEPGLLIQGRTHVPLRAAVEALGGTVSWQAATRAVTIEMNGKTFTRVLGSEADYSRVYQNNIWMRGGILYIPLYLLRQDFNLGVQWNAPAREAVAVNSTASRILIIPTQVPRPLRAPVAGVYPLANAGGEWPYLIGGVAGRRYLADGAMAPFPRGGEQYHLFSLTARLGTSQSTRPKPNEDSIGFGMIFTPEQGREAYGLAAPWDALPRRPVIDDPDSAENRQLMREVLDSRGMTGVEGKVGQAVACDLDGDGQMERLISASTDSTEYIQNPEAGDYSFVAIRQNGRTRVIAGEFFPHDYPNYLPNKYRLAALLDIDGDGRQEVIVHFDWFEGGGEIVYRVGEDGIIALHRSYNGL